MNQIDRNPASSLEVSDAKVLRAIHQLDARLALIDETLDGLRIPPRRGVLDGVMVVVYLGLIMGAAFLWAITHIQMSAQRDPFQRLVEAVEFIPYFIVELIAVRGLWKIVVFSIFCQAKT